MLVASVIVKCIPEYVDKIKSKLGEIENVTVYGVHNHENIVIIIEAEKEEQLEEITNIIRLEPEGVLGTYPTFISSEDDIELEKSIN